MATIHTPEEWAKILRGWADTGRAHLSPEAMREIAEYLSPESFDPELELLTQGDLDYIAEQAQKLPGLNPELFDEEVIAYINSIPPFKGEDK